MKLSTRGRYSVMALVDLATHQKGRPVTLTDIATRQEISLSYLEQLFGKLRRAGLVRGVRGPGGGYVLNRPADRCRIADIVMAVDEPLNATRCQPGSPEGCRSDQSRCITHDLWQELSNQIYLFLSSVTVADVLENRILGRSGYLKATGAGINIANRPESVQDEERTQALS